MFVLRLLVYINAARLLATAALAQSCNATDANNKCPQSRPCCAYSWNTTGTAVCGVGAACLVGCHPVASFSPGACAPVPVCQSEASVKMSSFMPIDDYIGDPSSADWIYGGQTPLPNNEANLTLAVPADGNRTVMLWPRYLWYGNFKMMVRQTSAHSAGIELYSDFSEVFGFRFYTNISIFGPSTSTDSGIPAWGLHALELRWTPDDISWIVDGQTIYTKNRTDAKWDSGKNNYKFPQTPAQMYVFIERAPTAKNGDGGIEISQMSVECFNATSPPGTNAGISYSFADSSGSNQSVINGDKPTVLTNTSGTGLDMPDTKAPENSTDVPPDKPSMATTHVHTAGVQAGISIWVILFSFYLAL